MRPFTKRGPFFYNYGYLYFAEPVKSTGGKAPKNCGARRTYKLRRSGKIEAQSRSERDRWNFVETIMFSRDTRSHRFRFLACSRPSPAQLLIVSIAQIDIIDLTDSRKEYTILPNILPCQRRRHIRRRISPEMRRNLFPGKRVIWAASGGLTERGRKLKPFATKEVPVMRNKYLTCLAVVLVFFFSFLAARAREPGLGGGLPHETRKSDRADGRRRRSGCDFPDAFQRGGKGAWQKDRDRQPAGAGGGGGRFRNPPLQARRIYHRDVRRGDGDHPTPA